MQRMNRGTCALWIVFGMLSACSQVDEVLQAVSTQGAALVGNTVVFDDAPLNGFVNASWGSGTSISETVQVHGGTHGASLTPNNYNGIQFSTGNPINLATAGYSGLSLWVHGGTGGGQKLWVGVVATTAGDYRAPISNYGAVTANTWTQVTVPFADLKVSQLTIKSVYVMDSSGAAQPAVYFDDITLVATGSVATGSVIFDDAVAKGFKDGGWGGGYSLSQTNQVHGGKVAASLTASNYNGVQFISNAPINLATAGYTALSFWINGGSAGGQQLWAGVTTNLAGNYRLPVSNYVNGGIPANKWVQVTVPLADLKVTQLTMNSVYVMDSLGKAQATVYLDDFSLVGGSTTGGGTPDTPPTTPTPTPGTQAGWLYTKGNRIYKSDGSLFHGRGANIADPRGCGSCAGSSLASSTAEVMRRIDVLVDTWGANFLRLDLESDASASLGVLSNPSYLAALQQIVAHVQTKQGVYMILSVWVDPSLDSTGWPTSTTDQILAKLATTFASTPNVLFGISNEPQNNYDGSLDSTVWQRMNDAAAAIRAAEAAFSYPKHIVLAQGTGGWSRFLQYYEGHPLTAGDGSNFAYEVHVYDVASTFADRFVTPSKTIPVIIGEFGPVTGMTTDDCATLMTQAEAAGVPYLAWTFHMRCPPNLITDNSSGGCGVGMNLSPTAWGTQLKNRLAQSW